MDDLEQRIRKALKGDRCWCRDCTPHPKLAYELAPDIARALEATIEATVVGMCSELAPGLDDYDCSAWVKQEMPFRVRTFLEELERDHG